MLETFVREMWRWHTLKNHNDSFCSQAAELSSTTNKPIHPSSILTIIPVQAHVAREPITVYYGWGVYPHTHTQNMQTPSRETQASSLWAEIANHLTTVQPPQTNPHPRWDLRWIKINTSNPLKEKKKDTFCFASFQSTWTSLRLVCVTEQWVRSYICQGCGAMNPGICDA